MGRVQGMAKPTSGEGTSVEDDLRLAGQLLAEIPTWRHEATFQRVLLSEDYDFVPESEMQDLANDIQKVQTFYSIVKEYQ